MRKSVAGLILLAAVALTVVAHPEGAEERGGEAGVCRLGQVR